MRSDSNRVPSNANRQESTFCQARHSVHSVRLKDSRLLILGRRHSLVLLKLVVAEAAFSVRQLRKPNQLSASLSNSLSSSSLPRPRSSVHKARTLSNRSSSSQAEQAYSEQRNNLVQVEPSSSQHSNPEVFSVILRVKRPSQLVLVSSRTLQALNNQVAAYLARRARRQDRALVARQVCLDRQSRPRRSQVVSSNSRVSNSPVVSSAVRRSQAACFPARVRR